MLPTLSTKLPITHEVGRYSFNLASDAFNIDLTEISEVRITNKEIINLSQQYFS